MSAKVRLLLVVSLLASGASMLGAAGCGLTNATNTAAVDVFPTVTSTDAVLYVSGKTGSSDGDGSAARPLSTIGVALAKLTPGSTGTTIAIAAGEYPENLTIPAFVSLVGLGADKVVISGKNGIGIAISGAGDHLVSGLAVKGSVGAGISGSGDPKDSGGFRLSHVEVSGVTASGARPGHGVDVAGVYSVRLESCSIHDNAGIGVVVRGGWASIIDPLFTKDPRGSDVGIIDPLFLPASSISHNAGGGVAIIDPLFLPMGGPQLFITATDVGFNGHFGVAAFGGGVAIGYTAIHGTTGADGDGVLLGPGTVPPAASVPVSSITTSILTGNARAGVLVNAAVRLDFDCESSLNGHGGLWAQQASASINTHAGANIARNTLVGIAASNGGSINVAGSRIADTQPFVYLPAGTTVTISAADGIGVYTNAHGFISGASISGNSRAAVLAKDCAAKIDGSPDLTVESCIISGSKWGVVVNGTYGQAAPSAGGTGSNSFDGVDAAKQADNAELPAPESACADGSYNCTSNP